MASAITWTGIWSSVTCASLLTVGRTRVHEPAYAPDPTRYVSWEYARGYADAVLEAAEDAEPTTPRTRLTG